MLLLEHAERRGIGQHQAGGLRTDRRAQLRRGRRCRRDRSGSRAPCSRTSSRSPDWCRAPRPARGSRCAPSSPRASMVGADHRDAANSPCAPAIGARLTAAMPVTSLSISCSSNMQARKPWPVSAGRQRVAREKLRQHRRRVARPRVVLHGARAERIEVRVDREVALRQARVVAHRVQLGHFRQQRRARCAAAPPGCRRAARGARRMLRG